MLKRFDTAADHPDIDGKSVLVTGGTGSFGQAFVRQVLARFKPRRLIVFSRDELKQWEMAEAVGPHKSLRYFIGDVRDLPRLQTAMADVDVVIHAAALKQVTTAEYNPTECIRTNIQGAENVVEAALWNGVRKVIALSTDKAVNPANLYGATKLASDKIFVAGNNLAGRRPTRFAVVRYGNVVGSRGSVVPFFQGRIAAGATALPITDPRMTRFWITLRQGVEFVLSNLRTMRGGEVYVPKIPSMRITEVATCMAPHLPHEVVGIRPGEKLHEVMITEEDARHTYDLGDRYSIEPEFAFWDRQTLPADLKPMAEDFRYASDNNPEWLDAKGFAQMVATAKEV